MECVSYYTHLFMYNITLQESDSQLDGDQYKRQKVEELVLVRTIVAIPRLMNLCAFHPFKFSQNVRID
jgi:hypothetical protein